MSGDIPTTGTITLEPNWEGVRRYVVAMARGGNLPQARTIAATMGCEAPDLLEIELDDLVKRGCIVGWTREDARPRKGHHPGPFVVSFGSCHQRLTEGEVREYVANEIDLAS
jgi:hypothetical protein